MASSTAVIKVDSPRREAFYALMRPYVHYVPVRAGIAAGAHPLRNLRDPNAVDVDVFVVALDRPCPRSQNAASGSSVGVYDCEYYRVESAHSEEGRSRTQVQVGVVKTVIGSSGV